MPRTFEEALQYYRTRDSHSWAQLSPQERRTLAALYLRIMDPLTLLEWLAEQSGLQLPVLVADVMEGKRNGVGTLACPHVTLSTTITLNSWHNVETLLALEWEALMKNQPCATTEISK